MKELQLLLLILKSEENLEIPGVLELLLLVEAKNLIELRWATSRPRLASKVTPSPHPGQGAYTGALWDPLAKIAPGQVAGNSNLKFGVRPRLLLSSVTEFIIASTLRAGGNKHEMDEQGHRV